ncbi:MAG: hypothetical protein KDA96_08850 [Planctomycetaceae bacterium]|nr:hypothetical protein [Planctomycetaceae bacterium]
MMWLTVWILTSQLTSAAAGEGRPGALDRHPAVAATVQDGAGTPDVGGVTPRRSNTSHDGGTVRASANSATANDVVSNEAISHLRQWLAMQTLTDSELAQLAAEPFSQYAISGAVAAEALELIWEARQAALAVSGQKEFNAREVRLGDLVMPFWYRVFGEKPEGGRSLYISMHGGGGAPARVNDQQYENQKRLYQPDEGIYLVPRAPGNTSDLWHQGHIDLMFDRLITHMIVRENVNPNRVYLMGYSAGGDGVYQLAPRMADRWAAASMMAGHPNESRPEGLRNIGFAIHVGAEDSAYNRNSVAVQWGQRLTELRQVDPNGYIHHVELHPGRGHWMNLEDASAVPWMARLTRNPWPTRVVWHQDDVVHDRFYWLRTRLDTARAGQLLIASVNHQTIRIEKADIAPEALLLHDNLINLDAPITLVDVDGTTREIRVKRTIGAIAQTILHRNDPLSAAFSVIPWPFGS